MKNKNQTRWIQVKSKKYQCGAQCVGEIGRKVRIRVNGHKTKPNTSILALHTKEQTCN